MITHPYACRVLQAALEQPQNNLLKKPIIDLVMADLFVLAKHSYGNYVVQHAIKFACARQKTTLISCVSRHVSILGRDKFGSNVVETCIAYGATTDKAIMVESILGSGSNASDGSPPIDKLVSDPFGNYVIQKLMKVIYSSNWFTFLLFYCYSSCVILDCILMCTIFSTGVYRTELPLDICLVNLNRLFAF